MSNTTLPPPNLPGVWRLVQPPADVTSAADAIVSACTAWKPILVEGGAPLKPLRRRPSAMPSRIGRLGT